MPAAAASPLLTVYLEKRDALGRFIRVRLGGGGGGGGDVEDVLQDLYIKVATLPADQEVREPGAFLYRLTANLLTDRLRSARRSGLREGAWRCSNQGTGPEEDNDGAPSAERTVAARQQLGRLVTALDDLSPTTRNIFQRHKFDGRSYGEVATELGISKSSVEKHMMRALRHLAVVARHED